ncbi:hypothetical protein [Thalassobacillus sp. CUG 92003]|uniref:hypothetical protein n=1 Tax=Thalassobacillus sp. CUG 92003 TaxID=2736641 RepID=UPI0015E784BD|nr:hypothetical protein [Thalassobacillus sp. CUG 92003]
MNVRVLGEEHVAEKDLPGHMYKSLKPSLKWKPQVNQELLGQGMIKRQKVYHPMWIVKLLVIAERKPFPPRTRPNMVFVDAISGYRGLFPSVPPILSQDVSQANVKQAAITKQELLNKYVIDVQEKQINRSYVLKKPRYEVKSAELVYLPLWEAHVETDALTQTFVINANTGESENLLKSLWSSREWQL